METDGKFCELHLPGGHRMVERWASHPELVFESGPRRNPGQYRRYRESAPYFCLG